MTGMVKSWCCSTVCVLTL
uniref:Uncharacterized protein n=1 Tax=Arundo donax TaxID=35708 RepID=A0A0A8XTB4_ARUDO